MPKLQTPRTKAVYSRLLEAFRLYGAGNFTTVAKEAGVTQPTAKRAYVEGWPNVPGCIPIKNQLEMDRLIVRAARASVDPHEQASVARQVLTNSLESAREGAADAAVMLAAAARRAEEIEGKAREALRDAEKRLEQIDALSRAKITDAEKAARATLESAELQAKQRLAELLARAKVDAAETMADEANAAKFGRKAALAAAAVAALVLKDAQIIAGQVRTALGDISKLSPEEAIRITRELVRLVEAAERSVILALQAERLRVGQPTEVIGVQSMDGSLEEREIKLKAVQRAIARAKAKGLTVVNGGSGATDKKPSTG